MARAYSSLGNLGRFLFYDVKKTEAQVRSSPYDAHARTPRSFRFSFVKSGNALNLFLLDPHSAAERVALGIHIF